jgi:uncharacterized protein YciI
MAKFFVVTLVHRNVDLWKQHLDAHVNYLKSLLAKGILRASGPRTESRHPSGLIILMANDDAELRELLQADPFSVHGVNDEVTITEWNPVFGIFASESSGDAASLKTLY